MKIKDLSYKELSDEDYHSCMSLTNAESGMRMQMTWQEESHDYFHLFRCIVIKENDKLLGWALLCKYPSMQNLTASFYVAKEWRRRGLGTSLVDYIHDYYENVSVFPHDDVSDGFFHNDNIYAKLLVNGI